MAKKNRVIFALMTLCSVGLLTSCPGGLLAERPPVEHPHYPSAMVRQDDTLFVVSANADLRYRGGLLLSLDLKKIDDALKGPLPYPDPRSVIVKGADVATSSAIIASYGERPVLVDANTLLMPSREHHELLKIDIAGAKVRCASEGVDVFGQECQDSSVFLKLAWHDPYYIGKLPSRQNERFRGVIGYLAMVDRIKIEPERPSLLEEFGELETFVWTTNGEVKVLNTYLLHDILPDDIEKKVPVASDPATTTPAPKPEAPPVNTAKSQTRRISKIGALRIIDHHVILGVESRLSYGDLILGKKNARLVWFPVSELDRDRSDANKKTKDNEALKALMQKGNLNLTQLINAEAINGLAFLERASANPYGKDYSIYVAMDEPSTLVRIDLSAKGGGGFVARYIKQTSSCERPSDVQVSPNKEVVLVACEKSHEIAAYDPETLAYLGRDTEAGPAFGRVPVQILFDERPPYKDGPLMRAYVSYYDDGCIGVFDVDTSKGAPRILVPRGRIFEQSPLNHRGGM